MGHVGCAAGLLYFGGDGLGCFAFLCLSTAAAAKQRAFDYSDLVKSCAVFLRFRDVAFISILDDVGMAQTALHDGLLSKLRGPLSPLQLRELFGHFAYARTRLTTPEFHTEFGGRRPKLTVTTQEGFSLSEHDPGRMGSMIAYLCEPDLKNNSGPQNTDLIERLRKGEISFLTVDPQKADESAPPA